MQALPFSNTNIKDVIIHYSMILLFKLSFKVSFIMSFNNYIMVWADRRCSILKKVLFLFIRLPKQIIGFTVPQVRTSFKRWMSTPRSLERCLLPSRERSEIAGRERSNYPSTNWNMTRDCMSVCHGTRSQYRYCNRLLRTSRGWRQGRFLDPAKCPSLDQYRNLDEISTCTKKPHTKNV